MGSNCCKGHPSLPDLSTSSFIMQRSRGDVRLDERCRSSEEEGVALLTVAGAQDGDAGIYTLRATNPSGSDTARVTLDVDEPPTGADPPTFARRLQDLTVKVGTRTRFLVEIISSTECKVTWYRNERRLLDAERVALAQDGNFWCVELATVSVDDAGRWTCTAENSGGRASCSAHLNVLVPRAYKRPQFIEELKALLTEQGTVSLECKVVGVPTPVLRWFKDSCEIKAGNVFALTANADDPTSLGTYTCEALNCMGRAYSSSKVHVVGRGSREGSARPSTSNSIPEPPPIFTKELEDQNVNICEQLNLSCMVVVPPWPKAVVWYNKIGKVEPSERYLVLEDGVGGYLLEVPSAEWVDEGEWKCVATSEGGRVGITTCYVTMDVPRNYRQPRFMENLQAVLTEEGLVSFECKVVGFPTPVLSWFKDGQELKPGDVYQLTGSNSLGSYCCIARNCMGQASSSAELTVEDIQNQLNEEEKLQLFSQNQAPKFIIGLKSAENKIEEPFRFSVRVAIPPESLVSWYRDDQPIDESNRCHMSKEDKGFFHLDIQCLEFMDQAEWKCVAMNDFGHSVTSCFLKLIIPRHYKKPRFLENLQAILSDEGAVNLECKVIGVPQPVLKWYKDGEELRPGDIHRIISGQDGTCCLGTYTCEAQNCMGVASSSASLLGFEDTLRNKEKVVSNHDQDLCRNQSLSTIHEERTSQLYDTPIGDTTLDEKGEVSFSFDGKEVSVSLYETPDLTEEEALQIVEMYADQLSENVTEHNVVELPPLRFVKETSTSGNLLMEAIIIDVSPEYFACPEEDLRTEADVEDLSIADENVPAQISLDQDYSNNYLEKTIDAITEGKANPPKKPPRRKSDSQKSAEDYFSLSREQSSGSKKDEEIHAASESDLQSFASANNSDEQKLKTHRLFSEDQIDISDKKLQQANDKTDITVAKAEKKRQHTNSIRESSLENKTDLIKLKSEELSTKTSNEGVSVSYSNTTKYIETTLNHLTNALHDLKVIEKEIFIKSELMSSTAAATRSLEIISSIISPLSDLYSIFDVMKKSLNENESINNSVCNNLLQPLKQLQQSLNLVEKCIEVESDSKTLVRKSCIAFVETTSSTMQSMMKNINELITKQTSFINDSIIVEIDLLTSEIITILKISSDTIVAKNLLNEANEIMNYENITSETKHLRDTQKALFELKRPLKLIISTVETCQSGKIMDSQSINNNYVILDEMADSIQGLQTALDQIENLSVLESKTRLLKYNTEVIETLMMSVLKLRTNFEQLKNIAINENYVINQSLDNIKQNIQDLFHVVDKIEEKIGSFDILLSENKLCVLQNFAQTLISLENHLVKFNNVPEIKHHLKKFHSDLTRILENIIESNDSKKYISMTEICDAVNRINNVLKGTDGDINSRFPHIYNTLQILRNYFKHYSFDSELNRQALNNLAEILVSISESVNKAQNEMVSPMPKHDNNSLSTLSYIKADAVMEHINRTIASILSVNYLENTNEFSDFLIPTLEKITPVLEEIKQSIAVSHLLNTELNNYESSRSDISIPATIAQSIYEINETINVFNQLVIENLGSFKENSNVSHKIAETLYELYKTFTVLQPDVISQYSNKTQFNSYELNIANLIQSVYSCILIIQQNSGIEVLDEISTLDDISTIKTVVNSIQDINSLPLLVTEQIAFEDSVHHAINFHISSVTAQELRVLNEHIAIIQKPEIINTLGSLSEISDYSSVKQLIRTLTELNISIEETLHPMVIEDATELLPLINTSSLVALATPIQELLQNLSIVDWSTIEIYENALELSKLQINTVLEAVNNLKIHLKKCIQFIFPALETTETMILISEEIETLRNVCENMSQTIKHMKLTLQTNLEQKKALEVLDDSVINLLNATDVSKGVKIEELKNVTEKLYANIYLVQDKIFQLSFPTFESLKQEATLLQNIEDVERVIAVLERFDFVDLSKASSLETDRNSQKAIEVEEENFKNMNDVIENVTFILNDSPNISDLTFIETSIQIFKSHFSIIKGLISKPLTYSIILRLLQEFIQTDIIINNLHSRLHTLYLPENAKNCLVCFILQSRLCLKDLKKVLKEFIFENSEKLFNIPKTKIKDCASALKTTTEIEKKSTVSPVISQLLIIYNKAVSYLDNIEEIFIQELESFEYPSLLTKDDSLLKELKNLQFMMENSNVSLSLSDQENNLIKNLTENLNKCDVKHTTQNIYILIILQHLMHYSDTIKEKENPSQNDEGEAYNVETIEQKTKLKTLLTGMLQPIKTLDNELKMLQATILNKSEDQTTAAYLSSSESLVKTMSDICRDVCKLHTQKKLDDSSLDVDSSDMSLINDIDEDIQSVRKSIQNLAAHIDTKNIEQIIEPIEMVEKTLHNIWTLENCESSNFISKEKSVFKSLADSLKEFISEGITVTVNESKHIPEAEKLQMSLDKAADLHTKILAAEKGEIVENVEVKSEYDFSERVQLAQKLQETLSAIQYQKLENVASTLPTAQSEKLKHLTKIITQLQHHLSEAILVAGAQITQKEFIEIDKLLTKKISQLLEEYTSEKFTDTVRTIKDIPMIEILQGSLEQGRKLFMEIAAVESVGHLKINVIEMIEELYQQLSSVHCDSFESVASTLPPVEMQKLKYVAKIVSQMQMYLSKATLPAGIRLVTQKEYDQSLEEPVTERLSQHLERFMNEEIIESAKNCNDNMIAKIIIESVEPKSKKTVAVNSETPETTPPIFNTHIKISEQVELVQILQETLSALKCNVLESQVETLPPMKEKFNHVAEIVAQLQHDLAEATRVPTTPMSKKESIECSGNSSRPLKINLAGTEEK